jgi:hypothetical protein
MFAARYALILFLLACCTASAFIGCSGDPTQAKREVGNLKLLGILYGKYVASHNGHMPPSEKEFLAYLQHSERSMLPQSGDAKQLLVSPRDGRPLTVVYGKGMAVNPDVFVVYESEPNNGTRLVAWSSGQVEEVEEQRFQTLTSGN